MPQDKGRSAAIFELDDRIDLATANAVVEGRLSLTLADTTRERCARAHDRLLQIIEEGRHVYGLTTGFGPLANRLVGAENVVALQQNLIHHLASGLGPRLGWGEARAVVLSRLMSISKGASGASGDSIKSLETLLASDLAPVLPSRGTVGASGDLTPLAHLVLCLQGRGGYLTRSGEMMDGTAGLERLGLGPLQLDKRDGLALVNGTSAMTGVALRTSERARRAIDWSLALTAAAAECLGGRIEAWHPEFARLRPHPGQASAAETLRSRVHGSSRVVEHPIALRRLAADEVKVEALPGQDAYSLRCAPQIIGAVIDQLTWHDTIVETELNSVTDNPVLVEAFDPPALHGGNFMGQHIALASDGLSIGLTVLGGLVERQVARITDEKLNAGLPAFLHGGKAGLNSGFMGAQVTATAILAEMRSTSAASMHSISTNGANQDVVSLGTIAARLCSAKLESLFEIEAILALCTVQAMELRGGSTAVGFSPAAREIGVFVRKFSAPLYEDRPLSEEIAAMAEAMATRPPP